MASKAPKPVGAPIFVPSIDPNEWCLKNGLHNGGLNPGPLGHESSALTTRPRLLANQVNLSNNNKLFILFKMYITQRIILTYVIESLVKKLLLKYHSCFSIHPCIASIIR